MQPYQVWIEHVISKGKADSNSIDKMKSSLVVNIDDVAEMYAQDKRDEFNVLTDFPNLAPPFESFFLQYSMAPCRGICWVAYVEYVEKEGMWIGLFTIRCIDIRTKKFSSNVTLVGAPVIDRGGKIIKRAEDNAFPILVEGPAGTKEWAESQDDELSGFFHIPFLAISLMHCKNVVKVPAPPPPVRVVKQWERRGRPFLKEYTLNIHPMKRVLATEGGMATNGIKKALHICRGHFATYTEDSPLFGKVTGTFWKPMHTRGSSEIGEIKKDYRIKP